MPAKRPGDALDETLKRQRSQTMQNDTPVILFNSSVPPDVEIAVYNDIYHLHSTTLRNCSQFFDRSLSGTWWREENTHYGADGIKYRYKLVLDKETPLMSIVEPVPAKGLETSHNAERMDVSESQISIADVSMTEADNSVAGHTHNKDVQETYSDLFHIFYNKTTDISCDNFERIKILVELADLYCSLPAVSGAIELLLIKFTRRDGRICTYADEIITIANRIHSKTLYNDSFVHLVGKVGNADWIRKKDNLSKDIRLHVLEEYVRVSSIQKEVDRHVIEHICSSGNELFLKKLNSGQIDLEMLTTLSELGHIYERNWNFCHDGPLAEEYEEQKGDYGLYQKMKNLDRESIIPGVQGHIAELLVNYLKLDDACTWGHLTFAELDYYPWEEADDW
ncbi:hypothetical protein K440DRAFT_662221 [Wilcoxina mikolae CBS 423.85]|nr:hypothetical protein K440DRAFT_662221 [Wilcoxina mikolae CBS 423.85]